MPPSAVIALAGMLAALAAAWVCGRRRAVTLSLACLLLAGLMLQAGLGIVTLKLCFIVILFFFMSPVATHALAQAALHAGIKPQLAEDRAHRLDEAGPEGRQP